MFGAWQAGAWKAIEPFFQPDMIVGASVGSLNGYALGCRWTGEELCGLWRRPQPRGIGHLPDLVEQLVRERPLTKDFAVVLTDVLRMKPRTFPAAEVTEQHLVASCAILGLIPPQKIGGRWYADGGLLNPLPVWAAVERGATRIVALHCLPEIPSVWIEPFVKAFRGVFGYRPKLPDGIEVTIVKPSRKLGGLSDALHWNRENVDRWIAQGMEDAASAVAGAEGVRLNISARDCFER